MSQIVQANSLVTLHYRISLPNGQPLISTFEATPATLQLGVGEMLPAMEQLLIGLTPGVRHVFELEIDEQSALVDFNHPLAGKSIRFEVDVIGVS